ncbi:PspC domain-containing protein [Aeromicrobium sp.]|uniref:PspC domain-containing protein n=1 Tax=Aeromicrobium sp. TaxID=1871063 RepID=UPI002FC74C4E
MKKLTRNPDDKWLGGVCGGLADYTGIDANLVRLIVVVCTLLGAGSLILAYIVAWVLMPARPAAAQTVWAAASDSATTESEPAQPSK